MSDLKSVLPQRNNPLAERVASSTRDAAVGLAPPPAYSPAHYKKRMRRGIDHEST